MEQARDENATSLSAGDAGTGNAKNTQRALDVCACLSKNRPVDTVEQRRAALVAGYTAFSHGRLA